ncbi:MAG: hypothetical protein ABJG14_13875 [Sulfitobacter sp.]|uniref:hypothetical protein n=1 Tax=Alphaproteobacteria TaxID=28211 RepID=UPI0032636A8C
MNETPMLQDNLTSQIEAALDTTAKTLDAITRADVTAALDGLLLADVLALRDRIEGLTIFKKGEHLAVKELSERLEPVILAATTVHYIPAEEWDINPPSEERVVAPYGLAAIDLRSRLRDLAARLAAVQNMLEGERIAADLRGEYT